MSKQMKVWAGIGSGLALLAIGSAVYFWLGDRSIRQVRALQEQLAHSDELSNTERNALKTQLMRTVDEVDRDQLRKLKGQLRAQQRAATEESITAYHAASAEQKTAVLDAALDRMIQSREMYAAVRTDRTRAQLRRGQPKRNAQKRRRDSGEKRQTDRDRGNRPEVSEEQRQQRTEFFAALGVRAEERGMEWNHRRRRNARPEQKAHSSR